MPNLGVPKGYKQSPEHRANIQKAHAAVRRAKKKLGLAWSDPLPPDHPLRTKKPKVDVEARREYGRRHRAKKKAEALAAAANGHDHPKINGANGHDAVAEAVEAANGSNGNGESFPLHLIPERKAVKKYQKREHHPSEQQRQVHQQHQVTGDRLAKLQLAAGLVQAINRILE